jgi:hypothetical protein
MCPVRVDARPISSAAARSAGLACGLTGDGIVLARLVRPLLPHRSLEGAGTALLVDPEGPELRRDRRDRRRAHHVATRAAWRRTQLGLSLLLVTRRDLDADGIDVRGLSRGGASVARVAPAQRGGKSASAPDHVRLVRRTAASGMGSAVVALPGRLGRSNRNSSSIWNRSGSSRTKEFGK